ncbi:MAG: CatB-related O-acetyltransferase [Phenylobacterium sp.]|nr:MAG: CatB-related O-acetyltransferase [Phenylobacterium sp.]
MAVLEVNPPLLDLLRRRRVFHAAWRGDRWCVGDRLSGNEDCRLEPYSQILAGDFLPGAMGAFSYSHSPLRWHVRIGRYGSIGEGVRWMAEPHPAAWASTSPFSYGPEALQGLTAFYADFPSEGGRLAHPFDRGELAVRIGHDVWIGDEAMVAPGVSIGDGAIIGARALVLDDVPAYAVMVGAPARQLRLRFPEPLVERFQALAWWRFGPDGLQDLPIEQPQAFLDALDARLAAGRLKSFTPRAVTFAEMAATQGPPV